MAEFVELDNSKLRELMADLEKRHASLPELYPTIGEILVSAVQQEFETGGRGKWPQLAQSTLERRRKEGRGAKILEDTGLAAGSVEKESGADFAMASTNVPYMKFHTSDEPRHVIPYRNPFDVDEESVLEEVADLLLQAVTA